MQNAAIRSAQSPRMNDFQNAAINVEQKAQGVEIGRPGKPAWSVSRRSPVQSHDYVRGFGTDDRAAAAWRPVSFVHAAHVRSIFTLTWVCCLSTEGREDLRM